jgi:uncharacterized membrane protein
MMVAKEGFSEEKVLMEISRLEKLGRIRLESGKLESGDFRTRLFSISASWYWVVIIFSTLAVASVLTIPSDLFPFVYIRWMFGLLLLLYFPGFCLLKSLFPKKEIANIETVIWSISLSFVLVLLVALFWNFTFVGLSIVAISVTLAALSIILATVAVFKGVDVRAEVNELAETAPSIS